MQKARVVRGAFCLLAGAMLMLLAMASAPRPITWRALPVSQRAVVVVGFAVSAYGLGALIDGFLRA